MKLAASTLGCPDWDFEKILTSYQACGLEGIEIRGINGIMDAGLIPQFFPEHMKETLEKVKEHHLKLIGFGTSCSFHDPDNYDSCIVQGKEAIDICRRMGIGYIRVFGDAFPDAYSHEETIARVICGLTELCEYAAFTGVEVYLEIHGFFNTIEAVAPILDAMKSFRCFGIIWDMEHSDRAYEDQVEPFYRLIRPYVRHVHVKDCFRSRNGRPCQLCPVGEGDIPISRLIQWLKRDHYDGYLSLEWEKKWHPELPDAEEVFPAYAEYMKKLI